MKTNKDRLYNQSGLKPDSSFFNNKTAIKYYFATGSPAKAKLVADIHDAAEKEKRMSNALPTAGVAGGIIGSQVAGMKVMSDTLDQAKFFYTEDEAKKLRNLGASLAKEMNLKTPPKVELIDTPLKSHFHPMKNYVAVGDNPAIMAHEYGHAKLWQNIPAPAKLPVAIATRLLPIGLPITAQLATGINKSEKVNKAVRDYVVPGTVATTGVLLADEAHATYAGTKALKKVLSPEQFAKAAPNKYLIPAFGTYLGVGIAGTAAAYLAKNEAKKNLKVIDKLKKNKHILTKEHR
jgi:hypothetical protein